MQRNGLSIIRARRRRRGNSAEHRQISLFAAAPPVAPGDTRHFRRQAQLCQRLLSSLHQPELVDLLGRLHEEYESRATQLEAASPDDAHARPAGRSAA